MSSKEDEGEEAGVYDVERILAEKIDDEGVHVYLVKWDGYPDEECTWEPAESFTDPDALREWAVQKACGDTLDAYDLQRIQDQMDAFKARGEADAESEHEEKNPPSLERSADMEEPGERPQKRLKLVHDTSLLTKGSTARPIQSINLQGQVSRLSQTAGTPSKSSSVQSSQKDLSKSRIKPTAPALHKATTMTAPVETPPEISIAKPVHDDQKNFFAPEMRSRVRADISVKRDNSGKRFNTYQHMNSVRKKMKEDRPPPLPSARATVTGEQSEKQFSENAKSPLSRNVSWLFFEEYENEESSRKALEQGAAMSPTAHKQQENTMLEEVLAGSDQWFSAEAALQPDTMPSDRVGLGQIPAMFTQSRAPLTVNTRTDNSTLRANEATTAHSDSSTSRSTTLQDIIAMAPTSASLATSKARETVANPLVGKGIASDADYPDVFSPEFTLPRPDNLLVDECETRPHLTRSSLFNRSLSSSTVVDYRRDAPVRPRSPQRGSPKPLSPTATGRSLAIEARSGMPTAGAQNFVSHGEVIRAKSGREWQKGDVVLDLYMDSREAGAIKLLHIPWYLAKPIIALKQGAQLPIGFSHALSRLQYESLAKDRWFSYFAIGSVEPFNDTADGVALMAQYLEDLDIAGLWDHPEEDIMLILYSCKSRSWQDVGQKPVRQGESRLHIAFRQKLREQGASAETLAQIVEHGKLAEKEEEVRGREIQRRAQNMEQRATSQKAKSSSRSRLETADPRKAVGRARSFSRSRINRSYGENTKKDVDIGQITRRASLASTTTIPPCPQPTSSLSSPAIQSPGVQLLHELQMTMSPRYEGTKGDDVRDISPRSPANSSLELSRTSTIEPANVASEKATIARNATTTNDKLATIPAAQESFTGFERDLRDFAWSPELPKINKSQIFVMLAYKQIESERIEQLQSWLTKAGVPLSHLFDKSISGHWTDFSRHVENSVCVVIFDKRYPLVTLDGLAKLLERDNFLCWEIDYLATAVVPLPMTRLFPGGIAMAISEGCFVHEPNATLTVLKWFKAKVTKPYSSSKLMIPPSIGVILQDQAILARKGSSKSQYLDLTKLLHEMFEMNDYITNASDGGFCEESCLHFSVVRPTWSEVYRNIPQSDEKLSAIDSKERDEEKDDKLLQYFGAWAFRHSEDHRRFIAFTINDKMGSKPKNIEHIRIQLIKGFADRIDRNKTKENERIRNQSRARSRTRIRSASAISTPRS